MQRVLTKPGPKNCFTDVGGLRVGQAHDSAIVTGTTVIVPDAPAAMAVDVRGGGPGTRETEALNPDCLVEHVHALVLSGGSVFGLKAADRIVERLSADGVGFLFGPRPVPVVPSAILFDLKNGGDKSWSESPYARLADAAYDALGDDVVNGAAGAGYGARSGARRGGLGTASLETADGLVVSALVAVNSFGSVTGRAGGADLPPGDIRFPKAGLVGENTTLAAVATNLMLDKAGCRRLAVMAQDGLARSIHPLHTPFDGDTVFAMATGERPVDEPQKAGLLALAGAMASDALVAAVGKAVAAANTPDP